MSQKSIFLKVLEFAIVKEATLPKSSNVSNRSVSKV